MSCTPRSLPWEVLGTDIPGLSVGCCGSLRGSQPSGSLLCPPVPVANKRDTRSIEEAMNEIRAKKRLRQAEDEGGAGGGPGGPCV